MFKFSLLILFGMNLMPFEIFSCLVNDLSHLNLEDFNLLLERHDYTTVLFYSSFNCTDCDRAMKFQKNVSSDLNDQFLSMKLYKNYAKFVYFATVDCDKHKKSTLRTVKLPKERTPNDKQSENEQLNKFSSKKVSKNEGNPVNELCNAYSVIDLPEWILFRFGIQLKRLIDLELQHQLSDLIMQNTKMVSIRFQSFTELITFLKQSIQPVVIGLFENINDRLAIDSWLSSIEKTKLHWNYKDVSFCHIFKKQSKGSLKELKYYIRMSKQQESNFTLPMIVLVRQQHMIHRREKRFLNYKFGENKEDINEWIKRKIFGTILWRSRDNEEELKLPLVVAYFNFDFKNNLESSYEWRNRIYDLALRNADLSFALSNSETFRKYLSNNDFQVEDYEPLFVAYDLFGYPYKFDELFSEYEFAEFLEKFRAGQLEPVVQKSSMVSEHQTDDQIIELSAKTFTKYVAHSKKNVFFVLYANWCSHCQNSLEAMKEIRQRFVKEDKVVFAQMECGDNEVPSKLEYERYPAFFFFNVREQKFVKFDGNNNLQSLINFIISQSTEELLSFDEKGKLRLPSEQEQLRKKMDKKNLNELKIKALEKQTIDIKKYAYGGHSFPFSGVFEIEPCDEVALGDENFKFKQTITLGYTDFNKSEVEVIISQIGNDFRGDQYHLLHKNCNHFTDALAKVLCGKGIPAWVNRLATVLVNVPLLERFLLPKELLTPIVLEENLCKGIIESEANSQMPDSVKNEQRNTIKLFRKKY